MGRGWDQYGGFCLETDWTDQEGGRLRCTIEGGFVVTVPAHALNLARDPATAAGIRGGQDDWVARGAPAFPVWSAWVPGRPAGSIDRGTQLRLGFLLELALGCLPGY